MTTIDLNADLGEGEACDAELLQVVSSCNIACGGHAGDAESIEATLREALARGVMWERIPLTRIARVSAAAVAS